MSFPTHVARSGPVATCLARQDGVVSRAQLAAAGFTEARLETLLRRRELVVVHPGVYLTHTGTPTWSERSWAAVLHAGRSALHLESALHTPGRGAPPHGPVDVAIDWSRPATTNGGRQYRDTGHCDLDLRVELDGSLHDTSEARDDDADRDLEDLAEGLITPRLRYRQVFTTPCRTASRLAVLFRERGWADRPHPCGAVGCDVGPSGEASSEMSEASFPTHGSYAIGARVGPWT